MSDELQEASLLTSHFSLLSLNMRTLLLLGFALSLDSFRVSLGLGALKMRPLRQAQVVLAFGLCDGLAPLLGMLIGQSLVRLVGEWTEYLGPVVLGLYGAYVIYVARRYEGRETPEPGGWIVLGIPLSLGLDNLIAGASLGLVGFPALLSVTVIGLMSALMALAGLRLGGLAANHLPANAKLLGGTALVLIALTLAFEKF